MEAWQRIRSGYLFTTNSFNFPHDFLIASAGTFIVFLLLHSANFIRFPLHCINEILLLTRQWMNNIIVYRIGTDIMVPS